MTLVITPAMAGSSEALAELAADNVPFLNDDLYKVIRAIVPPPPNNSGVVDPHSDKLQRIIEEDSSSPEKLFTRRPTEESLLVKVQNESWCVEKSKNNLEELYIQIVEPRKYTHEDDIMNCIITLMFKWPKDEDVQEKALTCLVCLDNQSDLFHIPKNAVLFILEMMKAFKMIEIIQRLGIRLMKSKKVLSQLKDKIEIACLIFNSLCCLRDVDDFIMSAEFIVSMLRPDERLHLRKYKPYVEMLLDFPNRQNDKITVILCWSSLDTLILLADSTERWNEFIDLDGREKLLRLSLRPELEDRCKVLLEKTVLDLRTEFTVSVFQETQVTQTTTLNQSSAITIRPLGLAACNSPPQNRLASSTSGKQKTLFKKILPVSCQNSMKKGPTSSVIGKIASNTHVTKFSSVDELITQKPPTPPPTVVDVEDYLDGQFSDDENVQTVGSTFATFFSPSPSYSPSPETSLFEEPPGLSLLGNYRTNMLVIEENKGNTVNQLSRNVEAKANQTPQFVYSKDGSAPFCFICSEPKGKQSLLMIQLRQISHCLLEPCNLLLLNCIKSNLCKSHSL